MSEEVTVVPASLEVPKESKEVLDSAFGLIEHFKNGGDLTSAALLLPGVLAAVEGSQKIGGEVKSKYACDLLAYGTKKVAHVLGL